VKDRDRDALFRSVRAGWGPTRPDRERLRARVHLAAATAGATAKGGALAARSVVRALLFKVGVPAIAVGAGVTAVWSATSSPSPAVQEVVPVAPRASASAPAAAPSAVASDGAGPPVPAISTGVVPPREAPHVSRPHAVAAAPVVERETSPPPTVTLSSPSPSPSPSTAASTSTSASGGAKAAVDPGAEVRLVGEMEAALRRRDTAGALALAAEHERLFPAGMLVEEREGARTIARCMQADRTSAVGLGRAFLAGHARSPLRARILEACGDAIEHHDFRDVRPSVK
jgi:hypothetical protein